MIATPLSQFERDAFDVCDAANGWPDCVGSWSPALIRLEVQAE